MVAISWNSSQQDAAFTQAFENSSNCASASDVGSSANRVTVCPGITLDTTGDFPELDRVAKSIEVAGSVFVLGLAVLQAMDPLPLFEVMARLALACWTLTSFRLVRMWSVRWLRLQAALQVSAMAILAFLLPWPTGDQVALDLALLGAGWLAVAARWKLTFSAIRIARQRAAAKFHRRRLQLLGAAA